jgi:chaperone modulatory protein CbpM
MKSSGQKWKADEVCSLCGVERPVLIHFIEEEWLVPAERTEEPLFDEEDLARARLIVELREAFGVNDEAVPIILHLLDQLYFIRGRSAPSSTSARE